MNVTSEICRELAALARLAIDPEQAESFAEQLDRIVAHIETLQRVDVDDVPEFVAHEVVGLRDDAAGEVLQVQDVMAMAPRHHDGYVVVPKFKED